MKQNSNSSVYTKPEVLGLTCTLQERITLEVRTPSECLARRHYVIETWKQPGRWGKSLQIGYVFIPARTEDQTGLFEVCDVEAIQTALIGSVRTSFYAHPADRSCHLSVWTNMAKDSRKTGCCLAHTWDPDPTEAEYGEGHRSVMRELSLEAAGFKAYSSVALA